MNVPTEHRGPALITLVGPTASGKTDISLALAERFGAHIINYDSVQLYAHLEIGSAKPSADERARAPHHLYEYGTPEFEPTAGDYARAAGELIEGLLEKGDLQEALNAAHQIGDDTLQRRTQGYVVPDSFNHGTSEQRATWFRRGFDSGRLADCDTFNNPI